MSRAWMNGKDVRPRRLVERADDRAQPLRLCVRCAVQRQRCVRLVAGDRRALDRDRQEEPRRVGHDVADDLAPAGNALRGELFRRPLVRTEEERRDPVDLDPVALLGHGEVERTQAGLDMRDGYRACRFGAGEGRVRVAVDEHPVRPLALDRCADRRLHRRRVGCPQVQPVCRLGQSELLEEDRGHLGIPVLTGVHDDFVEPRRAQRNRERPRLDELGAVPHHRQNPHADEATMAAASGR